jgi:DNA-binding transcriptional MerR regulator
VAVNSDGLYPIGTVSERTGVNSVTLRAWERRYGLLKPTRTPGGRRLYSEADISLIERVTDQLGRGMPISSVARGVNLEDGRKVSVGDAWQQYRAAMIDAVSRFDEPTLETVHAEAMALYPVDVVTSQLITPLLRELGERWAASSEGSIAEEHFFSVFLRNKLGARFHHRGISATGPALIGACLPGETHEFGLLLFALSAHARGFRMILLGADMPLHEIPVVLARTRASGIVLAGSATAHCAELAMQVSGLTQAVDVPVFVGGDAAAICRETIPGTGAVRLGTDIVSGVQRVREALLDGSASFKGEENS